MPHIVVEHSANVEDRVDVRELIRRVHEAALTCGVFEMAAVRTRAERRDLYEIANGDPANMFIHVIVLMAPGRAVDLRRRVGEALLKAVTGVLGPGIDTMPLALSVEVEEIDNSAMFRRNNLHERMKPDGRQEPAA